MREEPNAAAALGDFVRFPRWMWRNVVMEYVVAQLVELRNAAAEYANRDGFVADDEYFFAEQNARLVRNAEMYYRAMFGGHVESWNLRDTHMMETLDALMAWTTKRSGYLAEPRLERAIGVIYKPESERASRYFRATMADQFDAVIHIDTTSALTPLEQWSGENSDLPETYPTGV